MSAVGGARTVVLVPGVLALLPEYAGIADPVAELRAACVAALGSLAGAGPVVLVADAQGERVARSLLGAAGVAADVVPASNAADPASDPAADPEGAAYVVVANGSARRGEKAPGHLDERAPGFDEALGRALRQVDAEHLTRLDRELADQLLVGHPDGFVTLGRLLGGGQGAWRAEVDFAADPFGVQYWVMRWTCES